MLHLFMYQKPIRKITKKKTQQFKNTFYLQINLKYKGLVILYNL